MSEFTWRPHDDTERCSCGERYADRSGAVAKCAMCGDNTCAQCGADCPSCKRHVCKAHLIEFEVTPKRKDDICTDCAQQILDDEELAEKMFPAKAVA